MKTSWKSTGCGRSLARTTTEGEAAALADVAALEIPAALIVPPRLWPLGLGHFGTRRAVAAAVEDAQGAKQEDDIEAIVTASRAEMKRCQSIFIAIAPGVVGPDMKGRVKVQDRVMARCLAVLDRRQRRLWEALTGKALPTEALLDAADQGRSALDGTPGGGYGPAAPAVDRTGPPVPPAPGKN